MYRACSKKSNKIVPITNLNKNNNVYINRSEIEVNINNISEKNI